MTIYLCTFHAHHCYMYYTLYSLALGARGKIHGVIYILMIVYVVMVIHHFGS